MEGIYVASGPVHMAPIDLYSMATSGINGYAVLQQANHAKTRDVSCSD
jgi:hypothetical protein